jgi:phosphoglycerate dehydrogenase-like enzyme
MGERSQAVPRSEHAAPLVALAPDPEVDWLAEAIADGGGQLVTLGECEAIIWADAADPDGLVAALDAAPDATWVQLPFAGIENFLPVLDQRRYWTCGKGVYAEPVAELALTLALAGMRGLGTYARVTSWSRSIGTNLLGARVTIVGGGGIAESLIRLLQPFGCHITVVRSTEQHMDGVDQVLDSDRLIDALPGADLVVLALALTDETEGLFGRDEFELMETHAWIVNVARGRHIVTDDLVAALESGTIGGAGLEVTDPEPLPDGHPLWSLDNCIITPHTGTTPAMSKPLLAERVRENVRRFSAGDELLGPVDLRVGY